VTDQDDVRWFSDFATSLETEYVSEKEKRTWEGSPFYWIKGRPSRQIGAIGERLVEGWAQSRGFEVKRPTSSDHDRLIDGLKVEIKFSTLWTDNEIYKFQQLRDQDYEYCFLLGVSPFDVQAWFVPKSELAEDRPPALVPQHGGAAGRDTKWLSFEAASPPAWLAPFGGRLAQVAELIEQASNR
jgi:hypothetical protein